MKLRYVTGCVYNSLSVDYQQFIDMSLEERKEILHKLVDNANDATLQQMFIEYMENEAKCHMSDPCECCGDLIFEYNKEL